MFFVFVFDISPIFMNSDVTPFPVAVHYSTNQHSPDAQHHPTQAMFSWDFEQLHRNMFALLKTPRHRAGK